MYSLKRLTYAAINEGRFNGRRVPNRPIPANLRNFLWMYGFDRFSLRPHDARARAFFMDGKLLEALAK